jgi:predicted porin
LYNTKQLRTLVAVAAFAAITGAHAQVTISGLLDAAVTIDGTNSTLGAGPNGGSEFTLGLNEDLGNGLKAIGAFTIIGDVFNGAGDQFQT